MMPCVKVSKHLPVSLWSHRRGAEYYLGWEKAWAGKAVWLVRDTLQRMSSEHKAWWVNRAKLSFAHHQRYSATLRCGSRPQEGLQQGFQLAALSQIAQGSHLIPATPSWVIPGSHHISLSLFPYACWNKTFYLVLFSPSHSSPGIF